MARQFHRRPRSAAGGVSSWLPTTRPLFKETVMVRALRLTGWKPFLAVLVASGVLLWHLLACVESPMAFSPNGEQLAFVTIEPYGSGSPLLAGPCAYRLMVLTGQKDLRVLEEQVDYQLSAPGWSPDGKHLAYLRVPLMSAIKHKEVEAYFKEQKSASQPTTWPANPLEVLRPASAPYTKPVEYEDMTMPEVESLEKAIARFRDNPHMPVELVIREVATGTVKAVYALYFPFPGYATDDLESNFFIYGYLTTRPQYSPDGKKVFLAMGNISISLDLESGKAAALAAPVVISALSPDGKTVAALTEKAIQFIKTDGTAVLYRRCELEHALSGLAWLDNQTVGLLAEDDKKAVIELFRTDGTHLRTIKPELPEGVSVDMKSAELAVSPSGGRMVLVLGGDVLFLDAAGKVLKGFSPEDKADAALVQPVFSPDSKRVALKHMGKDKYERADAIVFFSADGKELARAAIPPIKPGTTRPATMPTTEKSGE
jgi:hypothetical protein